MRKIEWKNIFAGGMAIAMLVVGSACSTHHADIQYHDYAKEMTIKEGAVDGQSLGTVEGSKGGAIWDNCTEKARVAVNEMIGNAKAKGANAVGNVRWAATGTPQAGCKKSWGLLVFWPFVLTPLFMSSAVSATAFKAGKARAGLYLLPNTPAEQELFVQKMIDLAQAN